MRKLIFAALILFFSKNLIATSLFEGEQGYYEFHTERMPALQERLEPLSTPAAIGFKTAIQKAYLVPIVYGNNWRNLSANELCQAYLGTGGTDFGPIRVQLKGVARENLKDVVMSFLDEIQKENFEKFIQHQIETADEQMQKNAMILASTKDQAPWMPWSIATLRNFVNRSILGMMSPSLEGAEEIFQIMKETGVLETEILTTLGYSYSQKIAVREFLQKHKNVTTLVLGCGSFFSFDLADSLFGPGKTESCAMCPDLHHVSKNEMTISLMELGPNEEGAVSDVIGDFTLPSFWEAVREGLEDRLMLVVKDHTHYEVVPSYIDEVRSVLAIEGILEIDTFGSVNTIKEKLQDHNDFEFLESRPHQTWTTVVFKRIR